jgi:Pro-kumamolisin, activation domain/Bacterial Ig-like domain (group 3)
MRLFLRKAVFAGLWLGACAVVSTGQTLSDVNTAAAQNPALPSRQIPGRITEAIDDRRLMTLTGNVHPLARPEFDRGVVADAQPLHRMLLLLQRGADQESAVQQLLGQQQDKASANYQRWLTPAEYGAEYGPADGDIQTVTQWLGAQGFTNVKVGAGRTVIEFSGNAGQVRRAFHTEIHQYLVRNDAVGNEAAKESLRFANASDPQIPAALAPVVAGVVSLHNFPVKSHLHRVGLFQKSRETGETRPLFTFPGCQSGNCFGVGPADFAAIYNTEPLLSSSPKIDGSGQGIAIVGESNIDLQDVSDFRTMFGLPQNFSAANVILDGPDPGTNDAEGEADLDVQWSGAVAPGARIDFVTSASTETTSGIHLSAVYIVDHNLDGVMSESFGGCEKVLGTALNHFYNSLWEQAAAQGITVILSAGDGGSAGCDDFNNAQTATQGLGVSGFASTPFDVAVGGTDFDQAGRESTFWNTTATPPTQPVPASAKGYIPEVPWNDSCAQNGLNGCKTATGGALNIVAGSGGASTIYPKPSWQAGKGVPNDRHRDLPDVSLFAGNGFNDSFYIMCQRDAMIPGTCDLTNPLFTFLGVGGTSASAPAFAGIMALVNQKQATAQNPAPRQGNANYVLYGLAAQQNTANLSCNSSTAPVSGCNLNDVTKGNNSVPCTGGKPNCSSTVAAVNGVIVATTGSTTPAYTTTAGYDLATGLGSVNAANLAANWSTVNTTASTTTLTLNGGTAVNVTHGQAISFQVGVSPTAASGDVSLVATPSTGTSVGVGPFTLTAGAASGSTSALPGGTNYNVTAHYEGNGTYKASDSTPVAVTIAPEMSKVFISVPTFDPTTGKETGSAPSTLVYGSPALLRADVTNAQGTPSALCAPPNCPTGTVVFADMLNGVSQGAPNNGTFSLNSSGFAENRAVLFPGGANVITATYSGDSSFTAPAQASTYMLNVTPAPTQVSEPYIPVSPSLVGTPTTISTIVGSSVLFGVAPGGTITFLDNGTPIAGTVTLSPRAGNSVNGAQIGGIINATFTASGAHVITAQYSGDANYGSATTSSSLNPTVLWPTTMTLSLSATTVPLGQSVTVTAKVTTPSKTLPLAGSFRFLAGPSDISMAGTLAVDGSGNQTLTASTTITPQQTEEFLVQFGDGNTNYNSVAAETVVTVQIPDFSVSPNPQMLTLSPGQQASSMLTITPQSNSSTTVSLGCGPLTGFGVTCTVTPATINLANGTPVNATVNLSMAASGPTSQIKAKRGAVFVAMNRYQWPFGGATLMVVALLVLSRRDRNRVAMALGACSVIVVFLGCGGGSSGGGGGGGGNSQAPTSIVVTLSNLKPQSGGFMTATATVTSTKPLSGTISFLDSDYGGAIASSLNVVNGAAQFQFTAPLGPDQIFAKYSGDSVNQPSQSATVSYLGVGTGDALITATTGALSHTIDVSYTIQ